MKNVLIIVGAVILIGLLGFFGYAYSQKDILAVIDGKKIMETDAVKVASKGPTGIKKGDTLNPAQREKCLDEIIEIESFKIIAKKNNISVTDTQVNDEIKKLKERFKEDEFNQLMKKQNMSMEDLKEQIQIQLMLRELQGKMDEILKDQFTKIKVAEKDVNDFKEKNKQFIQGKEFVHAKHILVKTQEEADNIKKELKADGSNFSELAKKYSQDPGSAARGGDLGFFPQGAMVKEFDQTAFSMKEGEISPVVKTQFGFHIIYVQEKGIDKFVQDILSKQEKVKIMKQWFEDEKKKIKVQKGNLWDKVTAPVRKKTAATTPQMPVIPASPSPTTTK